MNGIEMQEQQPFELLALGDTDLPSAVFEAALPRVAAPFARACWPEAVPVPSPALAREVTLVRGGHDDYRAWVVVPRSLVASLGLVGSLAPPSRVDGDAFYLYLDRTLNEQTALLSARAEDEDDFATPSDALRFLWAYMRRQRAEGLAAWPRLIARSVFGAPRGVEVCGAAVPAPAVLAPLAVVAEEEPLGHVADEAEGVFDCGSCGGPVRYCARCGVSFCAWCGPAVGCPGDGAVVWD